MKIEYIARKVTLTDQTRQLAEKKIAKVKKYFNDILDIRLEIGQERHLYNADLFVKGKDFDVHATGQNKEVTAAIQEAVDKLEMQARKAKTRLKEHKQRHGAESRTDKDWSLDVLESESISSGQPRIVARSRIPVKPMSIEEAVLQMDGSGDVFLVFRNSANDRVNVVYRRDDKNLGLITPEF